MKRHYTVSLLVLAVVASVALIGCGPERPISPAAQIRQDCNSETEGLVELSWLRAHVDDAGYPCLPW